MTLIPHKIEGNPNFHHAYQNPKTNFETEVTKIKSLHLKKKKKQTPKNWFFFFLGHII